MRITTKITGLREMQRELAKLPNELRGKATQAALNKTAAKAIAEINRAVRSEFALKPSEVRNSINLYRAASGRLQATLEIFGSAKKYGRSLNMIHFLGAVQAGGRAFKTRRSKGVRAADLKGLGGQLGYIIRRAGGLKRIPGSFVGNEGRTIFRRVANEYMAGRTNRKGNSKHAQAIEPVQVIGVGQMVSSRRVRERVLSKINQELPIEVERAVRMILARMR